MKRWKAWQSRLWYELGNVQLHDGRGSTGQRGGSKEKPLGGGGAEKGGFREETEGECGMLCWLPSNRQSPFPLSNSKVPSHRVIQAIHGDAFLFVSSLRMNMWLYFGQWDVRGWSSWKAPLLDERRGHERRAWERGMRGDPFSFCALSSCLGGHDTWCQIIHFVITRGTSLSRLSMEKAWVIREMVE